MYSLIILILECLLRLKFLEREIATHSSILAWEIPWREEPDGLYSMGLQRVSHDSTTKQQQQRLGLSACKFL